MALTGCAGNQAKPNTPLESAEHSCEVAAKSMGDIARCDRYVAAAIASGDQAEIAKAYLLRSFRREFDEDLPGALADTDEAIAAWPELTVAKRRRGQLLAAGGDYAAARETFARLDGVDEDRAYDETLALIEYVDGDRTKTVPLFRSASAAYRDVEKDPWMAAYLGFNAAIVESELNDGDLAPIAAVEEPLKRDRLLTLLWRHRMGEIDDAGLLSAVEAMPKSRFGPLTCEPYFSIGHRNIIEGRTEAAREGFRQAIKTCRQNNFEYHAAKAWLRALGG